MKLLFVEDEFYTRNGIASSVPWESLGITHVETANDGKIGFERLVMQPDIILTDIRMPYHSGLELAAEAKKRDKNCEIIILSSYSDKTYLFTAISLSTVAYIEKPVNLDELCSAIRQAVERRKRSLRLRSMDNQADSDILTSLMQNIDNLSHPTRIIVEYLSSHYADPELTVDQLASLVHLNTVYASTVFKEETGLLLKRCIIDIRLEKARKLLLGTNLPVSKIAHQVGYTSPNYFAKLFRKEHNVSPNEYRDLGYKP